jgi:hypothetical protein
MAMEVIMVEGWVGGAQTLRPPFSQLPDDTSLDTHVIDITLPLFGIGHGKSNFRWQMNLLTCQYKSSGSVRNSDTRSQIRDIEIERLREGLAKQADK